jgi:hypothetical protein
LPADGCLTYPLTCQLFLLFTLSPAARRANFLPLPQCLLDGIGVTLKKQRADFQKQLGVSPKTASRFQKTPRCFTQNTVVFCLGYHTP